ncbi:MAG TPA: 30S ribosomal protein S6 [Candidatus Latescibacteria bacterium]|nr:30S ribosomal protein S6 [Candidatus Latescibacterota bacterium]
MKLYETTLIVDTQLEEELIKDSIEKVGEFIESNGGSVVRVENLGKRKLAYSIRKRESGYYVVIQFRADGSFISDLNRRLQMDESILRHLTVVADSKSVEPEGKDNNP